MTENTTEGQQAPQAPHLLTFNINKPHFTWHTDNSPLLANFSEESKKLNEKVYLENVVDHVGAYASLDAEPYTLPEYTEFLETVKGLLATEYADIVTHGVLYAGQDYSAQARVGNHFDFFPSLHLFVRN